MEGGFVTQDNKIEIAFEQWKKRSRQTYISAICKPCWEINYCPYGEMIETFPVSTDKDFGCRIFGHICPVYLVAEPFTETKVMRNITRNIPLVTKLKVMRRDNCVCALCNENIPDDKINFDHIIPWSKGGSSDTNNIRLLCADCNKSRGNRFESEQLVAHMQEAFHEPSKINLDMLTDLLRLVLVRKILENQNNTITDEIFRNIIQTYDNETDKFMAMLVSYIIQLLSKEDPFLSIKKKMNILRYRWGIIDSTSHSILDVCSKYKIEQEYYIEQEMLLIRQLGFVLEQKSRIQQKYFELFINNQEIEEMINVRLADIGEGLPDRL